MKLNFDKTWNQYIILLHTQRWRSHSSSQKQLKYWATFPGLPISPVLAQYPMHSKNIVTCLCALVTHCKLNQEWSMHVESLIFSLASHNLHRKQGLRLRLTLFHAKWSTFVQSIFEGSLSKEGFHGTHGTPSGSASDMSPWCSLVPKKVCMVWEHLVLLLVLNWPQKQSQGI